MKTKSSSIESRAMTLRILLDQNVPRSVCVFIRHNRPDWVVRQVADVDLWGAPDSTILDWARSDSSIVITFDEDFADARMYPVGSHSGVIRLRVWPTTIEKTEAALARVFLEVRDEDLPASLVIVDETRIRVRRTIRHG
jgi:predicted nuclease of predicted toxin-antitoxin system